jgi:hypothetical protein
MRVAAEDGVEGRDGFGEGEVGSVPDVGQGDEQVYSGAELSREPRRHGERLLP